MIRPLRPWTLRALVAFVPVVALLTTLPARAADGPDVQARISAPATVTAGSTGAVVVEMTMGRGWHVNSRTPSEDFLIPTELRLAAPGGTLSAVTYPKHVERRFAFYEKPLRVYEGTVRFETTLSVPAGASGAITVKGELSYQACNDQQCFAPSKIPLQVGVKVAPRP